MESSKFESIRLVMADRRERIAEAAFDLNNILARAAQSAAQGFSRVRVMIDPPLGLRGTKAADRAETALAEMGFEVNWQRRLIEPDHRGNASACAMEVQEMVIAWEGPSRAPAPEVEAPFPVVKVA